jgi:hypothetical protein
MINIITVTITELSNDDWAPWYEETSVDAAVNMFNAAVTAVDLADLFGLTGKNKYPS